MENDLSSIEELLLKGGIVESSKGQEKEKEVVSSFSLNNPKDLEKLRRNQIPNIRVHTIYTPVYKKPVEKAVELQGEIFDDYISMERFIEMYSKDVDKSKQILIKMLSRSLAIVSTASGIQETLQKEKGFNHINVDQSTISNVVKFWSIQELCKHLKIDVSQYSQWHNQSMQLNLEKEKVKSSMMRQTNEN